MTEDQRLEIAVGMRVMVRGAASEIPATVVEVGDGWFLVRSDGTGREFRTNRVVDILDAAETEKTADIALLPHEEQEGDAAKDADDDRPSPDGEQPAGDGKPPKRRTLANAAVEVLRQERRPLNTRELVRFVTERGLWTPTACRTPEQSLYGAFFLEIRNSDSPRIRKSTERGKFELNG